MIALLADVNIGGQVAQLVALMQGDYWREVFVEAPLRGLTLRIQEVYVLIQDVFQLTCSIVEGGKG